MFLGSELIKSPTFCSAPPCRITKYLLPDLTVFSLSSLSELINFSFLHLSHFQIGKGEAQYLLREIFQSGAFSTIFLNRPSLRCAGTQVTSLADLIIFFLTF